MDNQPLSKAEIEAKKKAEAKAGLILAVVLGSLIFVMIAGMLVFDIYAEKATGMGHAPVEAADR